jgi:hypothetical protein
MAHNACHAHTHNIIIKHIINVCNANIKMDIFIIKYKICVSNVTKIHPLYIIIYVLRVGIIYIMMICIKYVNSVVGGKL